MMNKELQEKIARLETELTEIKEMAVAMKKRIDGGGVFKPENGQEYWCILASGEVYRQVWNYNTMDHDRYVIGNCFPTEQAAEDFVRASKLIQKARETQNGFVPDWENLAQYKHHLCFDGEDIYVATNYATNVASIFGYWEEKSACEQFIDENEKDLLWFFTEYRR